MLVSALTIGLQIRHMISADLGYNTKDILVVDNAFGQTGQIRPLLDKWREEPCVEEVGQGDGIPLGGTNNWTMEMPDGHWVSFQQIQGDDKYKRQRNSRRPRTAQEASAAFTMISKSARWSRTRAPR